jgi:hypothetical protein
MTHTLTATQYEAAARLNLTVREVGPLRAVVLCPYCGGTRTVRPDSFVRWAKTGKVPTCEAVRRKNMGTDCRPAVEHKETT